ncbi:type II secretion system F family protein [Humidisolicoccus flavus]|uniref:type II secretion system F family protein n=1 Tax=Humidisolicoccus flavus TaxID=3111414 RepID=UPI0032474DB1
MQARDHSLEHAAAASERVAALVSGGVPLGSVSGYLADALPRALDTGHRGSGGFIEALRSLPQPAWRMLGATLAVATTSGAPVAVALTRIAAQLRQYATHERALHAAFAGPKATARLVLAMPPIALLFGAALGMNPLGVLFGSPIGVALLVVGLSLIALASWWSRKILQKAAARNESAGLELLLVALGLRGGLSPARARTLASETLERFGVVAKDAATTEVLALAERAGIPAAQLLEAEASLSLERERWAAEERGARAGVMLMVPLGVCVLPAFVLLAVVPMVLGIVQSTVLGF